MPYAYVHEDESCKLHGGLIVDAKVATATWILGNRPLLLFECVNKKSFFKVFYSFYLYDVCFALLCH
jgi:hypothetical protein